MPNPWSKNGEIIENYYIKGNEILSWEGWSISKYFKVEKDKIYILSYSMNSYLASYNEDKTYNSTSPTVGNIAGYTIVKGVVDGYYRFSAATSTIKNFKMYEIQNVNEIVFLSDEQSNEE